MANADLRLPTSGHVYSGLIFYRLLYHRSFQVGACGLGIVYNYIYTLVNIHITLKAEAYHFYEVAPIWRFKASSRP